MAITQFDVDQQKQTARQAALNTALAGYEGIEQDAKTKRAQALQDQQTALEFKKAGYDVTPEMVAQNRVEEPSGLAKFFGAKSPDKVDLFGNRTQEYKTQLAQAAEDRAFKRKLDEADLKFKQDNSLLDRQYKTAQMGNMAVDNQKKIAEMNDLQTGNKFKRELTQDQVKKLGEGNAKILAVKSGIDNALKQLDDPNLSEDLKLKVGQETLKLLNSAEGSDAVGAEEAQRLGSKLEFAMGNFFNGNPTQFGRDIPGFTEQLRNNSARLAGRVGDNENAMNQLLSGTKASEIAKSSTPKLPGLKTNITNSAQAADPMVIKEQLKGMSRQDKIRMLQGK